MEALLRQLPADLREAVEVEIIVRRNGMHDAGMNDFAIAVAVMEFVKGVVFTSNYYNKHI